MAELYRADRYSEAVPLGERALEIFEKALGPAHPDVAAVALNLGVIHTAQGQYTKAEPHYLRALAIFEKVSGPDHPDVATSVYLLASLYAKQSQYAKAEPYFVRALTIFEKAHGPEHPAVARILNDLAFVFHHQGQYAKEEPFLVRALTIREKALGPEHPDVATCLNNLAGLYETQGQYERAEPYYIRALTILEKALGPEDPYVATCLNNLAVLYTKQGKYSKAHSHAVRALTIREKVLGPDHPDVAGSLRSVAGTFYHEGRYEEAEPLLVRALTIVEKALDPEHPDVATSVNDLAGLYDAQGLYAKAEPLHLRALRIYEKALGPEHPLVATSLNNLAGLYVAQGQYEKAEPHFVRALMIREKALGPEHSDVAEGLNNLATNYRYAGRYAKAEPLHLRALRIYEKALGPEHPRVAMSLNNLGMIYRDQGQYAKAEPLLVRSLKIVEKALGPEHPDVGTRLSNLALLHSAQGHYAKAEPLYLRALEISEKALGPEHPTVAAILYNVAGLRFATGDLGGALLLQERSCDAREAELRRNLTTGSQQAKLLYLWKTRAETDFVLSLQAACGPKNTSALRLALTQILRRKGRTLDALVDQLEVLARSGSPEDRRLLDELSRARADRAALILRGPGVEGIEQHRADRAAAGARVDELEAQASARSSRVRAELSPITLDAIRAAVPQGVTLIEYATYRPYDPKSDSLAATRYVVYTLGADGTIRWADLGEAVVIDTVVAGLREALRAQPDGSLVDVDGKVRLRAQLLDTLVFAPVRKLVGASTRLLIAPDGQLSLVPFDALVDEQGRYAAETYEISYLTSGRDLLRPAARVESRQPETVLANPDFGVRSAATDEGRGIELGGSGAEQQAAVPAVTLLARAYFRPLPGTAAEAEALRGVLPGSRVLTGAAATKKELTALSGPRVLHLATHGFFLAGERPAAALSREIEHSDGPAPPAVQPGAEDPLVRSGLALAGANLHQGGDGILTSPEAAGLDLWGTRLVVLSACDTGVGEVRNGDGVYGLRRAFLLAGSETQVMSLWPVSDAGTRDLMIAYYRRLAAGEGRSAAMRAVRLEMLKDPKRRHPYFWAGFIVSGEWANLDGKR